MQPEVRGARLSRELLLAAFGLDLSAVEPWVIDRLTSIVEEQDAHAGEALYHSGDPPEFLYFTRGGQVSLLGSGSGAHLVEGRAVLGMYEVVLDRPRPHTAVALTDMQLMKVDAEAWLDLLEDSFELARTALDRLARSVSGLEDAVLEQTGGELPYPQVPEPRVPSAKLEAIERLALLVDQPLLRGAGVQTLSDLAALAREVVFQPGDVLVASSAHRPNVFLVVEGRVTATRPASRVVRTAAPGDIVCGTPALVRGSQPWEATAAARTRALSLRVDDMVDLMEEHFDMVRALLGALSVRRERLLDALAAR
jgi:CRP-like cAMP-binding protein